MRRSPIIPLLVAISPLVAAYAQTPNTEAAKAHARGGEYEEAIRLEKEGITMLQNRDSYRYAFALANLAVYNSYVGNYDESIRLTLEALPIYEKFVGKDNQEYLAAINNLTNYYAGKGDYVEAIRVGEEALVISRTIEGGENAYTATILGNLADFHYAQEDYEEAVEYSRQSMEIKERVFGKQHPTFARSLGNLAFYCHIVGDYQEAVMYGSEAVKIYDTVLGPDYPEYASFVGNLAGYYSADGNYSEAIKLGQRALEERERTCGRGHPDYASALSNLADYNSKLGNYPEAIRLETVALAVREKSLGNGSKSYALSLGNLAYYNSKAGNYQEALCLGKEALAIDEAVAGKSNRDYTAFLGNLASYNARSGNFTEAIRLGLEALQIDEQILGKRHPDYAVTLSNLANYYSYIGNYNEAISLASEALELREEVSGQLHPDYAVSLGNLAGFYSATGNFEEAIKLGEEAVKINEIVVGKEHPAYALSLSNLAYYNSLFGDYSESVRLGQEVLAFYETSMSKEHPDYASALSNQAHYNAQLGNYAEAVRLETVARDIKKRILGEGHPAYGLSLNNLTFYYFAEADYPSMERVVAEFVPLEMNSVKTSFASLTANERVQFWNKKQYIADNLTYYTAFNPAPAMIENAYNFTLLSKGIILNTEVEFDRFLAETGSSDLADKYNEIRKLRLQLNKLYEKPIAERWGDTDALEKEVARKERDLLDQSKEFGDYTRNLALTWENVRNALSAKDVAIEFATYKLNRDSTMYAAYVLKRDMEYPQMVRLFEEKDLLSMRQGALYNTPAASRLVWGGLQPYMEGCENVYFAPVGLLHQIAIESLPGLEEGDDRILTKYNFYRLTSTRELALQADNTSERSAVVYGGIVYDMAIEVKEPEPQEERVATKKIKVKKSLPREAKTRAGIKYLEGTRVEVENITNTLTDKEYAIEMVTGEEATEESFKMLSGKNRGIVHVATHGFYWQKDEADDMARMNRSLTFMAQGEEGMPVNMEDKALTRSGLFMAGAAHTLAGKDVPEGLDDGILTAAEIARLNLRATDLVVLSACQTGMGEISGDGVFGLQRGFKKAGVRSILMSLWDVDDAATEMLMSEFYRHYSAGETKQQSLLGAQKAVREFEGEAGGRYCNFSDPHYWAAFILLDGIDR